MTDDALRGCFEHLVKVIVLCQTTRESWTPEDAKAFRAAREFVQLNREDSSKEPSEQTRNAAAPDTVQEASAPPSEPAKPTK